jgi:hypothetical protein
MKRNLSLTYEGKINQNFMFTTKIKTQNKDEKVG